MMLRDYSLVFPDLDGELRPFVGDLLSGSRLMEGGEIFSANEHRHIWVVCGPLILISIAFSFISEGKQKHITITQTNPYEYSQT